MSDPTHIKDLEADPENLRVHNARNIGVIVDALQEVGAARSIVIDEDNVVLAGNGVVEAAADAGITAVRVVEAHGNEIIAVRRRGLTPEQKKRLALYDNRAGELSEWDEAKLGNLLKEQPQLREKMWTAAEVAPFMLAAEGEEQAEVGESGGPGANAIHTCPSCGHQWADE